MSSTIKVNNIQNLAGDDSGIDLSTNDQIILKTANTTAITVDSSQNTTFSGQISESGKEYFHVDLTTLQDGLAEVTVHKVDFGGKGTVKYDTKSNFDTSNDAYLLDSSDGVYLISYSIGIRSDVISTAKIIDAGAMLRVATDGSTFAPIQGSGSQIRDDDSGEVSSVMFSGTFIYKSTNATTKIDLTGFANTLGGATIEFSSDVSENQATAISGGGGADTARCTFLTIVRIA